MKSQEQKRKEAIKRGLEYAQLPLSERIKKAEQARGESKKQLAKLHKQYLQEHEKNEG